MKNKVTVGWLESIAELPTENILVLDTETTGLDPSKDEVLSIAIVDGEGNDVYSSLLRPESRKRWPKATEIHGITWQDVRDKPTLVDVRSEVAEILNSADLIVGYNTDFDMRMLKCNGLKDVTTPTFDLMDAFSRAYGNQGQYGKEYLWMKLSECADHYGYEFKAHDALNDAKATAYCYQRFHEDCIDEIPRAKELEEADIRTRRNKHIAIAIAVAVIIVAFIIVLIVNPQIIATVVVCGLFLLWILSRLIKR